MKIRSKKLIAGAWYHYGLYCPQCGADRQIDCPRGDAAVLKENPCSCDWAKIPPKRAERLKTVKEKPIEKIIKKLKGKKKNAVDSGKLSVKSSKGQSSKKGKGTSRKNKK